MEADLVITMIRCTLKKATVSWSWVPIIPYDHICDDISSRIYKNKKELDQIDQIVIKLQWSTVRDLILRLIHKISIYQLFLPIITLSSTPTTNLASCETWEITPDHHEDAHPHVRLERAGIFLISNSSAMNFIFLGNFDHKYKTPVTFLMSRSPNVNLARSLSSPRSWSS